MIIKSLFRRYERWNPVHPTYGAFWGVGIGIGCGVGWGPGFGPEVIGYVGAGCGAGFSVGLTFFGVGIGLPANHLFAVPYGALMVTRKGALEVARFSGLLGMKNGPGDGWGNIGSHISSMQRTSSTAFSSFKEKSPDMKSMLISPAKPIRNYLERVSCCFFHSDRGSKN
ncbi:cadmium-induced protein AS8 [Olea europaea var. sylvestris]|uniref:Cadmium-induced AS8 n=1 Tax=Olea europaea subsp. europaea TaxID=158383 RepID=A0A8S0Q7A6_OLEEU|nr:cadmium-induced protein AS8 [Olea europaea var. sylvestris]XP_022856657.1 cadmium-induced protein AS8 [Olea europaea var. sylvestris]CAA2960597.1 cadmium-induced AS8 [Olea europaea subsp. europaea]